MIGRRRGQSKDLVPFFATPYPHISGHLFFDFFPTQFPPLNIFIMGKLLPRYFYALGRTDAATARPCGPSGRRGRRGSPPSSSSKRAPSWTSAAPRPRPRSHPCPDFFKQLSVSRAPELSPPIKTFLKVEGEEASKQPFFFVPRVCSIEPLLCIESPICVSTLASSSRMSSHQFFSPSMTKPRSVVYSWTKVFFCEGCMTPHCMTTPSGMDLKG